MSANYFGSVYTVKTSLNCLGYFSFTNDISRISVLTDLKLRYVIRFRIDAQVCELCLLVFDLFTFSFLLYMILIHTHSHKLLFQNHSMFG